MNCTKCDKTGNIPCPRCHGKGLLSLSSNCPICNGSGRVTCSKCGGKGKTFLDPNKLKKILSNNEGVVQEY